MAHTLRSLVCAETNWRHPNPSGVPLVKDQGLGVPRLDSLSSIACKCSCASQIVLLISWMTGVFEQVHVVHNGTLKKLRCEDF